MSGAGPSLKANVGRVALTATAVVAAAYIAISIALVAIVTSTLTAQVDGRLQEALDALARRPGPGMGRPFDDPGGGRRFGPGLLVWTRLEDGRIASNVPDAALPVDPAAITRPTTIQVAGVDVRAAGMPVSSGYVVVGQTMDAVGQAQGTVVVAELAIAPLLLLVVFLGAVAIGRRAAAPIEAARLRQMAFTADASHELRTPLSVIEAQTSLALAGDRSEEWYRTAFGRVDREAARMRRLVEDMLWLARFDAARAAPAAEPVDLATLAAGTVDRFASVAETRGLALTLDAPASAVVVAPPEWLDRLLGVLVDNACRYAPDGGRVTVRVRADDGRVTAAVEDDGPGIPPEARELIFDRFHRATDAPGGSGLGLAIADAIVRATNGRWTVGDSPAGGASMTVAWPRGMRTDA